MTDVRAIALLERIVDLRRIANAAWKEAEKRRMYQPPCRLADDAIRADSRMLQAIDDAAKELEK